jgi:hypothetical protein
MNSDMTAEALGRRADRILTLTAGVDWDEVEAFFTDHSEQISDDAVNGGRYYWEYTCTLIGVDWNSRILTRDEARAEFGDKWVTNAEDAAAEDAEEDAA